MSESEGPLREVHGEVGEGGEGCGSTPHVPHGLLSPGLHGLLVEWGLGEEIPTPPTGHCSLVTVVIAIAEQTRDLPLTIVLLLAL